MPRRYNNTPPVFQPKAAEDEDGRWWLELDDELETVLNFVQNIINNKPGNGNGNGNGSGDGDGDGDGDGYGKPKVSKNLIYGGIGLIILIIILYIAFKKK
jgi:hypothetical protein